MEMITINIKRNDFKQPNVLRENIVQSLCDHIVYHLNEDGNGTYGVVPLTVGSAPS